jgi:hypothetical protein
MLQPHVQWLGMPAGKLPCQLDTSMEACAWQQQEATKTTQTDPPQRLRCMPFPPHNSVDTVNSVIRMGYISAFEAVPTQHCRQNTQHETLRARTHPIRQQCAPTKE